MLVDQELVEEIIQFIDKNLSASIGQLCEALDASYLDIEATATQMADDGLVRFDGVLVSYA